MSDQKIQGSEYEQELLEKKDCVYRNWLKFQCYGETNDAGPEGNYLSLG